MFYCSTLSRIQPKYEKIKQTLEIFMLIWATEYNMKNSFEKEIEHEQNCAW